MEVEMTPQWPFVASASRAPIAIAKQHNVPSFTAARLYCYPTSQRINRFCDIIGTGMVAKSVATPLLSFDSRPRFCSYLSHTSVNVNQIYIPQNAIAGQRIATFPSRKWELHCTAQIPVLGEEDNKTWESCKQELSAYGFTNEDQDKILGKAFGQIHSPYWGEEREKEVPRFEVVSEILSYLKDLGLTEDDIGKLLKKFPEVLGCNLEIEVKANVGILEKEWGIKGKTLKNLLLRNPRVLGYNIDCKGDCMAQCTRCWARF